MSSPTPPSKPPLRSAIRGYVEDERRGRGPHLEADELVAYHERRLAADAAERVRDHLVLCPECADLLLDLGELAAPAQPAGAPDLTTGEVEAAWRELAPRLRAAPAPVPMPRRALAPVLPWALAAALLVAVVGLSARMVNLQQPEAGVVDVHLDSVTEQTRGGGETQSASRPMAVFLTRPSEGWSSDTLEIEIHEMGTGGRLVWKGRVQPDDKKDLTLSLRADYLRPGTYRLRAYPLGDGKRLRPIDYELPVAR
jgi:hypothetical protein